MANSFFRTVLNRVIEVRQRQAEPYINGAAMNFDDKQLAALGLSRAELASKPRARSIFQDNPWKAEQRFSVRNYIKTKR